MRKTWLGLEGCFCMLCHISRDESSRFSDDGLDLIRDGIPILRNSRQLDELVQSLDKDLDGNIATRKGKYSDRQGLFHVPMVNEDLLFILSPLHNMLRV